MGLALKGKCPECGSPYERPPITENEIAEDVKRVQGEWNWWDTRSSWRDTRRFTYSDPRCTRCDYPLMTDRPAGECPECGNAYDKSTGKGVTYDELKAERRATNRAIWWNSAVHLIAVALVCLAASIYIGAWAGPGWMVVSLLTFATLYVLWLYATDRLGGIRLNDGDSDEEDEDRVIMPPR